MLCLYSMCYLGRLLSSNGTKHALVNIKYRLYKRNAGIISYSTSVDFELNLDYFVCLFLYSTFPFFPKLPPTVIIPALGDALPVLPLPLHPGPHRAVHPWLPHLHWRLHCAGSREEQGAGISLGWTLCALRLGRSSLIRTKRDVPLKYWSSSPMYT